MLSGLKYAQGFGFQHEASPTPELVNQQLQQLGIPPNVRCNECFRDFHLFNASIDTTGRAYCAECLEEPDDAP